jgi:hypothetical protein
MTEASKKTTSINKGRVKLLLLLSFFIIPFVIARLAYFNNWFKDTDTVNIGDLISPPIQLTSLDLLQLDLIKPDKKWRILFTIGDRCSAQCLEALYTIHQSWIALGKEIKRVDIMLPSLSESNTSGLPTWVTSSHVRKVGNKVRDNFPLCIQSLNSTCSFIYLADPIGNVILKYPVPTNRKQAIERGKDILTDLKKLLKASQIG